MPSRAYAESMVGRRAKWVVLGVWVIIFIAALPFASKLSSVIEDRNSAYLPGSAESTQVMDLQKEFPGGGTMTAVVVYAREGGMTEADRATARTDARQIAAAHLADGEVSQPIGSLDGGAIVTSVPMDADLESDEFISRIDRIREIVADVPPGVTVNVTGYAAVLADFVEVFNDVDGTLLLATLFVVAIILLITYRSPVLWLVPLFCVGVALVVAQAVVYALAKSDVFIVNGQSQAILTVLTFGAGTDYALLLIARYREELRRHESKYEAMREAVHRAGPAIVASAITVVLSLLCLIAAELESDKGLGPVGAVGIVAALAAMMTLLPAILVICGRWVFWPFVPHYGSVHDEHSGVWARVGDAVAIRPRVVWLSIVAVLALLTLGTLNLDANGLTNTESFRTTPDSIVGQRVVEKHFPGGQGSPAIVIASDESADQVAAAMRDVPGVDGVSEPEVVGDLARIQGVMGYAFDSDDAYDTVDLIRDAVHDVPNADAKVGGDAALQIDTLRAAGHDTHLVIPLVLLVVLLVLGVLLRSIIAPLLLLGTVVLSFGAALGASALMFEHLFGWNGADSSLPLIAFIFLVALGIDYNIFLMTRVREEAARIGTREGMLLSLAVTGGVITSAGCVLAATFSVLAVLPVVQIIEVGVVVAFGVLLDTFIVRCLVVPALVIDVDRRVWWPSRLAHATPTENTATLEPSVD